MNPTDKSLERHDNTSGTKSMRLLILCTSQFGYHLDTYYYCKHGRNVLDITYVGFRGTRPPVDMDGIRVKPVSYRGNKIRRFLRWCWTAWRESRRDYDVVFFKYFPGCSIIRLLVPGQKFVFDVRTGSITRSRWRRRLSNALLTLESKAFANVTVISESLARMVGLSPKTAHILPLGADVLATNAKNFDGLHLLYVGTLSGREIEKTIMGSGVTLKTTLFRLPVISLARPFDTLNRLPNLPACPGRMAET